MTALGVIPARKNSERFPGKHHVPLLGKPMLAYTLEAALASKRLDRVVVSSDDLSLKPLADRVGAEFIERPANLATATATLEDAVRHAYRLLASRDGFRPDLAIVMQGNVPVRKAGQIDEVICRLEELPRATAVCTAQEIRLRSEWGKRVVNEATGEVVAQQPGLASYRTQDLQKLFAVDGAVCGVQIRTLMAGEGNTTAHAWLGERLHLLVQDHPMYSIEVDYPDQVPLAEFYLLSQRHGERWYQVLGQQATVPPITSLVERGGSSGA